MNSSSGVATAMSRARKPVQIVPKGWGREVWIANNDLYCGKILEIRRGKRCSLHFHKLKTESFYLRVGRLRSSNSEPANAWTSRAAWCIRWKRSKMLSCSNFPRSTSIATRTVSYRATEVLRPGTKIIHGKGYPDNTNGSPASPCWRKQ